MIENTNEIHGYQLIETFKEGIDLFLYTSIELKLCKLLNVEILILIGHSNISSFWNKLEVLSSSKEVLLSNESSIQWSDIILKAPFKVIEELIIKVF